ncbi:MAG: hypothetical protein JRF63_09350 [Deltaproteobacteria bacterium]|nr:hypothetical protein [Deltaproteobacteria bacterium]
MASLVRNFIAGMSAREKRMAAAMLVVMLGMGVGLAIYLVRSAISEVEDRFEGSANILKAIELGRDDFLAAKQAQRFDKKARGKPMPLRTLVDKVAEQTEVTVPDVKEIPDKVGEVWIEHAVELSIRDVGLESMTVFMEKVEDYRRKFPIAITKLKIRKRRGGEDSFDVMEMMISTYEQVEAKPDEGDNAKAGGPTAGKGGR